MRDASISADLPRLSELTHQVKKYDRDLGKALSQMAERFDYEKLNELLG
jgi:hypothetical protein